MDGQSGGPGGARGGPSAFTRRRTRRGAPGRQDDLGESGRARPRGDVVRSGGPHRCRAARSTDARARRPFEGSSSSTRYSVAPICSRRCACSWIAARSPGAFPRERVRRPLAAVLGVTRRSHHVHRAFALFAFVGGKRVGFEFKRTSTQSDAIDARGLRRLEAGSPLHRRPRQPSLPARRENQRRRDRGAWLRSPPRPRARGSGCLD